ncbi:hypothetical protein [Sphingobacterium sp. UBA6645]|uniref:hypothetical protein n=1 Tax=Sphingobacterium sp. UBA6645 TaxID=1947511 RepID=UPI0025CD80CD|nr:hypothetical protein [Sphingobacterium sp. UBA6645]
MARLQVEIDGNASGLTSSLNQANAGLNKFNNEANKVANQTGKLTSSLGSANGVAMEFNRIIQDAPFGMMGIGNNITQLTSQFGALKQQTGSTGAALKQTFSSLLSSGNLLSLGISAVVTGWTLWERHAQKADKATKDLEDGTKTYIETLKGLERASADANVAAIKETNNLDILYRASQNVNLSYEERKKQADALINQYPETFKNHTSETIVAGQAADAYNRLAMSLIATAKAQANMNKVAENSITILNRALQANDIGRQLAKVQQERIEAEKIAKSYSTGGNAYGAENPLSANAQSKLNALLTQELSLKSQIAGLNAENGKTLQQNQSLENTIIGLVKEGADLTGKTSQNIAKAGQSTKETKDIMQDLIKSSLSDYDKKIFEINAKYDGIFSKIKEIGDVSRRKDAFGLATQAKQFETLQAQANRYIDSIKKLKPTKPTELSDSDIAPILPGFAAANKRFNKSIPLAKSKDEKDLEKRLGRVVERGFRTGISNIADNITDLGSDFKEVFSNVFTSLAGSVGKVFQDMIATQLGDKFAKMINQDDFQIGKLSNNMSKGIVAGAGIAGSLISGMSSKTSTVGQVAGGALSGAAAGMAFGPYGALAGAVIGGVSGLFSASSARKSEKQQEEMLKEQRKQTAIMERQSALAWASNIIGQMTTSGMVNGLDRNAKGELVAKVSGQDLMFVLNRAGGNR